MRKNRIRFKGHESFIIREGWLNKGLQEVHHNPQVFRENYGADALGVGPNMAKSIRYWLRCSGLSEEQGHGEVNLTGFGNRILERDPYFEDIFSLWAVHCNIARNWEQATAWELFFNCFHYEEFTREELEREMQGMGKNAACEQKLSEKSVRDDCDAILRMYTVKKEKNSSPEGKNVSPFSGMGLLKKSGDVYSRKQPDLNRLPADVVWYLLPDCLERRSGIGVEELLVMPGGPGRILQLRRTGLTELLEQLEAEEKIIWNRTAGLDMVYLPKGITPEAVTKNHYDQCAGTGRRKYV